jgi:hypothetical protein
MFRPHADGFGFAGRQNHAISAIEPLPSRVEFSGSRASISNMHFQLV